MTLFFRALILGYAVAVVAAAWLFASGMALWSVCLIGWIGGNALGLAFTVIGAMLWPAATEERERLVPIEADLRLWEAQLAPQRAERELWADREVARVQAVRAERSRKHLVG